MRIRSIDDFGAVARQRRRDLGLSQAGLAERSGVARQWLVRFEQGNTEVSLSKVFAVLTELDLLVRLDPIKPESASMPKLVIPNLPVTELQVDEARLTQVREAIQFLERGASTPAVNGE